MMKAIKRWFTAQFRFIHSVWIGATETKRAKWDSVLLLVVLAGCAGLAFAKPILDRTRQNPANKPWAETLTHTHTTSVTSSAPVGRAAGAALPASPATTAAPTVMDPPAVQQGQPERLVIPGQPKSEAELYGDQLQALTAFYESVITLLGLSLGIVAGLAFVAVRLVSMREVERTTHEELKSPAFQLKLKDLVAEAVSNVTRDLRAEMDDVRDLLEATTEDRGPTVVEDDDPIDRTNAARVASGAPAAGPTRPPTPAASFEEAAPAHDEPQPPQRPVVTPNPTAPVLPANAAPLPRDDASNGGERADAAAGDSAQE